MKKVSSQPLQWNSQLKKCTCKMFRYMDTSDFQRLSDDLFVTTIAHSRITKQGKNATFISFDLTKK
ncbi:hypothetical protein EJD97_017797 [Solanum chilense]|uniref:Uncharacterized protein n=1 Tax=Solanum chilense TaxID=4083 RepID=A0A6N2CC91_SOLCI|nr:hypothetical protein EJD97_017797 [Solanum chilense]